MKHKVKLKDADPELVAIARRELPTFEKKMEEAQRDFEYYRSQRNSVRQIIENHERQHRPERKPSPTIEEQTGLPAPQRTPGGRAPRGLVYKHVEEILKDGNGHKQLELRSEIQKRFSIEYGNSSIYRALDKGRADGRYKLDSGKWSVK
jgi:hypothetical protein